MSPEEPPAPSPELTGQGGYLQPAPVEPHTPEDTRPRVPSAPPDTSGGYAVGGAIGSGVRQYAGQPAVPPDQAAAAQPQATTGSGAPPVRLPAPGQAIGTDSMAAQLNQQELARVQGGRPDSSRPRVRRRPLFKQLLQLKRPCARVRSACCV